MTWQLAYPVALALGRLVRPQGNLSSVAQELSWLKACLMAAGRHRRMARLGPSLAASRHTLLEFGKLIASMGVEVCLQGS